MFFLDDVIIFIRFTINIHFSYSVFYTKLEYIRFVQISTLWGPRATIVALSNGVIKKIRSMNQSMLLDTYICCKRWLTCNLIWKNVWYPKGKSAIKLKHSYLSLVFQKKKRNSCLQGLFSAYLYLFYNNRNYSMIKVHYWVKHLCIALYQFLFFYKDH